ncbi:MAG TPA: alpha/beta fold hydrolase [Syntrophales bacterium]|nr:alpha/beta fold hydrolase [Syntrophales bacterium]HQB30676.1 alpha/beta fold hydrolase [Syntrophales bacterium]
MPPSQTPAREGNGETPFRPGSWASNPHLQSMAASLRFRALPLRGALSGSVETIVDCGNDVRLLGFLTRQKGKSRGLFLLLHGWEGSMNSAYMLHTGGYLVRSGFDVFRLNLRDHGPSHHLNRGLFHGALTEEVIAAAARIGEFSEGLPYFILGFSLGGNFALRIAARGRMEDIPGLKRVFAVSPVLDPMKTTLAIDGGFPFYRRYFRKKWQRSLKTKEHLFPDLYRFDGVYAMKTLMEMTDYFVGHHSPFRDARDYFSRYTLLGNALDRLAFPVTILTSEDDPIIPVDDFRDLRNGDGKLTLSIQPRGGHCGFIDPFPFGCWYEPWLVRQTLPDTGKGTR